MRGIVSLSHFTHWTLAEVEGLYLDNFRRFLQIAQELAKESYGQ